MKVCLITQCGSGELSNIILGVFDEIQVYSLEAGAPCKIDEILANQWL
jgi:hypothetical protein